MADQVKSLGRRKSIVDLAFNALRGRGSKHGNGDSKVAEQGQKTNSWDLFGSLRSSISPSRHQQENGPPIERAQSSSPPKRGPLGVRLKRQDPSTPTPKLKRRKSLGDILTLGRSSSRKGKASTIGNIPSQPTLKPKGGSPSLGNGFLTLPEAAMEDYISESSTLAKSASSLESSNSSSHKCVTPVTKPTNSQTQTSSKDPVTTEGTPAAEQSDTTPAFVPSELRDSQITANLETIHEVRDSSPERSPSISYAEVLNGEIPDWAVDVNPDFKSRQASLNMQYNALLDRSDMQWLAGVDATLEYNDKKVADEMEKKDYEQAKLLKESPTDSLESIIAYTAARMSKNFQVNSTEMANHRSPLERQISGSDSTAVTDTSSWEPLKRFSVPLNFHAYQDLQVSDNSMSNNSSPHHEKGRSTSDPKGKSIATDEIDSATTGEVLGSFNMIQSDIESVMDDSNPYLRGGHERASSHISLYTDRNPQLSRRGARNTKRVNSLGPPISVNYPGCSSKKFASLSDALSDIFAQEHLDLSDYCKYDMIRGVIQTCRRSEQEPLHVLIQTAKKDQDVIWTPNFRRLLPRGGHNIRRTTPSGHEKDHEEDNTRHLNFMQEYRSMLDEDQISRSNTASEFSHFSQASTFNCSREPSVDHQAPNTSDTSELSTTTRPRVSSGVSSKCPLMDDRPGSYLITSYDGPEPVTMQWREYIANKQLRTPSLTTLNSTTAVTSVHYEQSCKTSSRLPSALQRQTLFNESVDSHSTRPYEMPIEDSDHLKYYLGSDYFSASDGNVSFTSESPESVRESQFHLTKDLEEEGVASSLKDTNLTEAPKTKNWLDMVREYKAAKLVMQSEVVNGRPECSSSSAEDIKFAAVQTSDATSLALFGDDSDSEDGAGSVEDNLLSDSEIDSDENAGQLSTVQIPSDKYRNPSISSDARSDLSHSINNERQNSTLKALEQQLRSQTRRDSAISFASGFKFSNYNHFGSTSELRSNISTSRCVSQDSKGEYRNAVVAGGNTDKAPETINEKSWFTDSYTASDSDGAVPVKPKRRAYTSHRRTTNHSTRLMTPSGGVHLPSTTVHPNISDRGSTPIRRTPTPHSGAVTPVSHPNFLPVGLPGLGLCTAYGHLDPLRSSQNRSSQESGLSQEIENRTRPGELVRKGSKVEHIKTTTKARSTYSDRSELSLPDMSYPEYLETVDSGTEADDEEEKGEVDSSPFWQDYFASQTELLKKNV